MLAGLFYPTMPFNTVTQEVAGATLSGREAEVMHLLRKGLTYGDIGSRLHISPETVRRHVTHIYRKLHVKTRAQALLAYAEILSNTLPANHSYARDNR